MGLARGRGKGRGGLLKPKGRGIPMKPPPLMGRLAPPPPDMIRPRGMPVPPPCLMPRMRPPPPGMRSPRLLPPLPLGARRPPLPPFVPPPPPPPAHAFPPAVPPRPPMPLLRPRPGQRPPPPGLRPIPPLGVGPPVMGRIGRGGKRMVPAAAAAAAKGKPRLKKTVNPEEVDLNKPWITESIKNEILKKQKLYQKAKKSNSENDWKEFKDQKSKVITIIREAKLEYIGSHPEEANEHFCETCDREFSTEAKLAEHIQEHHVCGLDGCQFTAHPKVIKKHIQMQHETGLYYRINKLYKPEDLAKWIAERKRNYPTKENIERKQAALDEKIKRGERLSEDKRRFQRNTQSFTSGSRRGSARKLGHGKNSYNQSSRNFLMAQNESNYSKWSTANEAKNEVECSRWKLQPFCGTAALQQTMNSEDASAIKYDQDLCFSDSEWEPMLCEAEQKKLDGDIHIPLASKALSNLMCFYASDTSDSEGGEKRGSTVASEEVQGSINTRPKDQVSFERNNSVQNSVDDKYLASVIPPSSNNVTEPYKHEDGSDSAPEEVPIICKKYVDNVFQNFEEENKQIIKEQGSRRKRKRHHNRNQQPQENKIAGKQNIALTQHRNVIKNCGIRKLTLLEKLLNQEIRHERNVILQCVRYVVQNNFFEMEKPRAETNLQITKLLKCIQHILKNDFLCVSLKPKSNHIDCQLSL